MRHCCRSHWVRGPEAQKDPTSTLTGPVAGPERQFLGPCRRHAASSSRHDRMGPCCQTDRRVAGMALGVSSGPHLWVSAGPARGAVGTGLVSSSPADPARRSFVGPRPLKPNGPAHLGRLAEVSRHPAGCIEAQGPIADQRCQVSLKVLEVGGTDLPLPLIAQLVEDHFALAQHLEA